MKKTAVEYKVIFTADDSWWQARESDFEIDGDTFDQEAFAWAEKHLEITDNDESFACVVSAVNPEHTAIRVGDVLVSDGCGADKIFLRRI